jgi:alpha-1,6-mannosyltransferase
MNRRDGQLAAALAAVPLAFAAGGAVVRVALRTPPKGIATDLAQPLPVVTAWHAYGGWLWAVLAVCIAIATAAAIVAIADLRRRPPSRAAACAVFVSAAAALVAALGWPVVFSSDVYAYAAYGDLAARGLDPYVHNPVPQGDALAAAAAWQWGGVTPPCVYGPAFVAIARLVAGAALPAWETLLAFRLLACVAFLTAAGLFSVASAGIVPARLRLGATAAFALNPVALWCVAEGHNDALMVLLAIGGAALVRRPAPLLGGFVIALASLVKAPGIALGAALALWNGAPRASRRIVMGLAAGSAVTLAWGAPVAIRALGEVGRHGRYAPQFSTQALGAWLVHGIDPSGAVAWGVAITVAACACIAVVGVGALRARDAMGLAWLALAVWLALPNPYPWYALWVLPIAAVALEQPPFTALWAATISIAVRYLPDAFGPMAPDRQAMIAVIELAPLLYALRDLRWPLRADQAAAR